MKLSKYKKERLVNEVLKRKFNDKDKSLNQLASSIVESLVMKELSGIPFRACEKFISFTTYAYYGFGDTKSYRSGEVFHVTISRVPDPRNQNWYFSVDKNKDLMKIAKKKKAIEKDKDEAKEMLWNVMNSCNTEKQLIETIPEMQPIMITLFDSKETTSIVAVETVEKVRHLLS
jgi:hypothetical protein